MSNASKRGLRDIFGGKKLPRGYSWGDIVEALVGYLWLKGEISAEELVALLYMRLQAGTKLEDAMGQVLKKLGEKYLEAINTTLSPAHK